MCWNKGRLCWKIAKLFDFCHLKKLVRPETFGPYHVYYETHVHQRIRNSLLLVCILSQKNPIRIPRDIFLAHLLLKKDTTRGLRACMPHVLIAETTGQFSRNVWAVCHCRIHVPYIVLKFSVIGNNNMLDATLRGKSKTSYTNLRLVRSCMITDLIENTQLFFR